MAWPKPAFGTVVVRDGLFPDRLADPGQALRDLREAHAWVSREILEAEEMSTRLYNLVKEKERLFRIFWQIKGEPIP